MNNRKAKGPNPLFVVTRKGKVVEEAQGYFDALVKRMGVGPLIEFFKQLIKIIIENFKGDISIVVLQDLLDKWILVLNEFNEQFDIRRFVKNFS